MVFDTRAVIELNAQKLTHGSYTWGGTDHANILVRDSEPFGASISCTDSASSDQLSISETLEIDELFILPDVPDFITMISGTIIGGIKARMYKHLNGSNMYIPTLTVDIVTIDSDGTETSILSSGAVDIITTTWSETGNAGTYTRGYPFWINVDDASITAGKRLGLRVKVYAYHDGTTSTSNHVYLDFAKNSDDIYVKIPFVMGE